MFRLAVPTCLLLLAAAPAAAVDTVDLQVAPRARVLGSVRPMDERESYLVATVRGASVRAVAKRDGEGPVPSVEMLDGAAATLVTGKATRHGAKISRFEVPSGGLFRFRVTGDGLLDGDFQLDLTIEPRELWTGAADVALEPGVEATFSFAAPAGATADIEVRRASGGFAPRILDVTGPTGSLTAAGEPGSARLHEIEDLILPVSGEHLVRFRNDGDTSGRWRVRVKLRAPSEPRAEIDLRDDALGGSFAGEQTVFGRIATPEAPTLIVGPEGTGLAGVSILIPAGALPAPTLIGMAEAETFVVGEDVNPAGQALTFTPAGTTFDPPAAITAPYDPQAFDDPATQLTAVVVEDPETGDQETIPVTSVDTGQGTVTYPASHFSRFQPVSPAPRSLRGEFIEIEFVGAASSGFGGSFTLGLNQFEGLSGLRSQHGLSRAVRRVTASWQNGVAGPTLAVSSEEALTSGLVTVESNTRVTLTNGAGDFTLSRGVSPDVLGSAAPRKGGVEGYLVFRRADGDPMRGNLVGGWHGAVLEFSAQEERGRVVLRLADETFLLDVDKAGGATASGNVLRTSTADVGALAWKHETFNRLLKPGALDPAGPSALLSLPIGANGALREATLDPVLRGDALIGGGTFLGGDPKAPSVVVLRLVVLVRRGSGFSPKVLFGRSVLSSFSAFPAVAPKGQVGIDFSATVADLVLATDGTFTLDGARSTVGHTLLGAPSASSTVLDAGGFYSVSAEGRISFGKSPLLGFASPRRDATFFVDPLATGYLFGASVPATKLPIFGR